jgi:hypothetical protein
LNDEQKQQKIRFISNEFLMNAGMFCGAQNAISGERLNAKRNIKSELIADSDKVGKSKTFHQKC